VDKYIEYNKAAQNIGVTPVFRVDVQQALDYLTSKFAKKPSNVEEISHKEANPQLFSNEKISEWKDKHLNKRTQPPSESENKSKLSKMDDNDLRVQAQLQLLAQQQQQQATIIPKERKKSRFDQTVHPTKGFTQQPLPMASLAPIPVTQIIVPPQQFGQSLNPYGPSVEQQQQQQLQQQQLQQLQQQQLQQQQLQQQQLQQQQLQQQQLQHQQLQQQQLQQQQLQQQRTQPDPLRWNQTENLDRQTSSRFDVGIPSRNEFDFNRRSPTFERMQEVRPRSPSYRTDVNPFVARKDTSAYDPFNPTASPPRHSGGVSSRYSDPRMENPFQQPVDVAKSQRDQELEQQRLWEEYRREQEVKKRQMEEEEREMIRQREAELEKIRLREAELERIRIRDSELEKIRKREEELEMMRLREEEMKKIRLREEELEKARLKKEEAAKFDKMWKARMAKESSVRVQPQQDTEWERRMREFELEEKRKRDFFESANFPPPPKIDGFVRAASKPMEQLIDLTSDDEEELIPGKAPERKGPPPPPVLSSFGKKPWETGPSSGAWEYEAPNSDRARKSWSREKEIENRTSGRRPDESDQRYSDKVPQQHSNSSSYDQNYDRRY